MSPCSTHWNKISLWDCLSFAMDLAFIDGCLWSFLTGRISTLLELANADTYTLRLDSGEDCMELASVDYSFPTYMLS